MIAYLTLAMSRHGATVATLFTAATALAVFVGVIAMVAAELDSIPVALVITTMILLPLSSSLASLARARR